MASKTIREQLAQLSVAMAEAESPGTFRSLVKQMTDLLVVDEVDHLLEAWESRLRDRRKAVQRGT